MSDSTNGSSGSSPTQTSPFGSSIQSPQPAFGSSIFGSSTPFGASSQPAFGSTGTPAFGAPSIPAFGANSTPAFGTTSTPAFGATSTPAFGSTTTPAFGSTGSAFGMSNTSVFGGGGAFGQNTSPFGQTGAFSQPSLFNLPSSGLAGHIFSSSASLTSNALTAPSMSTLFQTAQPAQSSGTFAVSNFGQTQPGIQTPTQAFANTAIGQLEFGDQQGGSRVASYSATFIEDTPDTPSIQAGTQTPTQAFANTAIGQSEFRGQQRGSRVASYSATFIEDTPDTPSIQAGTQTPTQAFVNAAIEQSEFRGRRGGSRVASYSSTFVEDTPSTQIEELESISAIPFYQDMDTSADTIFTLESILAMPDNKDKSYEELRWEDYQLGDKGGGSSFGVTPGIFGQNNFELQATPQNSVVAQPALISTNPFGTLPALPQMSIGRVGNTPSVQYGISSMPVQDKPAPVRISSVFTARHLSQRRIKYPLRKYKNEDSRVPFFSNDDDTPTTYKRFHTC